MNDARMRHAAAVIRHRLLARRVVPPAAATEGWAEFCERVAGWSTEELVAETERLRLARGLILV